MAKEIVLVEYDKACRQLERARYADEVTKIRDAGLMLSACAKVMKNKKLEADAWEIRVRAERKLGEMLVYRAAGNEWQHGKPQILSRSRKRGRIADQGRAGRHARGTARTPVQFSELSLFDRRPGQDANCAFIGDEVYAVVPGEREIGIPQTAKLGQDRGFRRGIGQCYRRHPKQCVENHHGMLGPRQPL